MVDQILQENPGMTNKTQIAKVFCKITNQEYSEAIRHQVRRYVRKEHSALFEDHLAMRGIEIDDVKMYWDKTERYSIRVDNPVTSSLADRLKDHISELMKNISAPIFTPPVFEFVQEEALRIVLSDMHVGMDPGGDGSLFKYEYNEEIFMDRIDEVISEMVSRCINKQFEVIMLDDLGDGLDGYGGKTTRGGHALEQNMTSLGQFKVFIQGKMKIIDAAAVHSPLVIVNSVSNDNHSGELAEIANETIKMLCAARYGDRVVINNLVDFVTPVEFGNHCFLLCHGKDAKHMFKNWPLKLDPKTRTKIEEIIDEFEIDKPYIHLDKGDLHQLGYDRVPRFAYRNFMSFAPPSNWVQHNFGVSYSGFSIQEISKWNHRIKHTDIFFNNKRKKGA